MQVGFREEEAQVVTGRELLLVLDMALKFRAQVRFPLFRDESSC